MLFKAATSIECWQAPPVGSSAAALFPCFCGGKPHHLPLADLIDDLVGDETEGDDENSKNVFEVRPYRLCEPRAEGSRTGERSRYITAPESAQLQIQPLSILTKHLLDNLFFF